LQSFSSILWLSSTASSHILFFIYDKVLIYSSPHASDYAEALSWKFPSNGSDLFYAQICCYYWASTCRCSPLTGCAATTLSRPLRFRSDLAKFCSSCHSTGSTAKHLPLAGKWVLVSGHLDERFRLDLIKDRRVLFEFILETVYRYKNFKFKVLISELTALIFRDSPKYRSLDTNVICPKKGVSKVSRVCY